MNMKKIKIISAFLMFVLSFPAHFMYEWFPNFFTSIFFPVNESVWEHMKIIYTSILITTIIEYFIYKYKNIKYNNLFISIPITSTLGIIIYLLIYYPLNSLFGHSLILSISILFFTYILCSIISYYILNFKKIKNENFIGLILIVFSYIIFTVLTYMPHKISIFYDIEKNIYGIDKEKESNDSFFGVNSIYIKRY